MLFLQSKYSWREVFTNLGTRQSTAFWDRQWCSRRLPDIDASSWRSISSTVIEPAMLSMLNKCMTSVGSYIGTLVPSSVIVTLTKHVQILGEAYPFRELLPLNFFLTAVRAWRPLVHLFVFVFEGQCIYMAKILHPFKCKV